MGLAGPGKAPHQESRAPDHRTRSRGSHPAHSPTRAGTPLSQEEVMSTTFKTMERARDTAQ